MNRFTAGLIAGGIVTAIGMSFAMNDSETRRKLARTGRKVIKQASNAMDDFADNVMR